MKRKFTSLVLAIAVMLSMSVPAFAADCRAASDCAANVLLWQLMRCCGTRDTDDLLGALLRQYEASARPAPQPQPAAEPEANAEAPAGVETPAAEEPSGSAYEREVMRLVNAERAKYGLAPLAEDALLTKTARMKSRDMHDRGYFDHNSPTYGTPFQLMKTQGVTYRTAGENIAMGYRTPEAVVSAWMDSPGHRANILNASYTKIGVGYVASGNYWTQHFTG